MRISRVFGPAAPAANGKGVNMKTDEREQRIIDLLESRGEISIEELSTMLNVSPSTLRRQLALMQSKGLVIRTYGGAMSVNPVPDESFDNKLHKNVAEKRRIAAQARSLLKNGMSISLGSGTTVYDLSNLMDDMSGATIYTNSMQTADYLARCASLEVHIASGVIRRHTGTVIGNEVTSYFNKLNVDYAFVSCDAIDLDGTVYSDNLAVATSERSVILHAKHKVILCDSSKFGKRSIGKICSLDQCDALITGQSNNDIADAFKHITRVIYV